MVVITEAKKLGKISMIAAKAFPFKDNKYEFNLTHIILFAVLVALLSMVHHPAQDAIKADHEKEQKAKAKKKDKKKDEDTEDESTDKKKKK